MTTTRHTTMWDAALERAERLHCQFFRLTGQHARVPAWEPSIEVFEHDGRLAIVVVLPGVPPDRVNLDLEGETLVIAAERTLPWAFAWGVVYCLEIPWYCCPRATLRTARTFPPMHAVSCTLCCGRPWLTHCARYSRRRRRSLRSAAGWCATTDAGMGFPFSTPRSI